MPLDDAYKGNPIYPDRYTKESRWTKVLPVYGRALQSAELIEIQSILQSNLKDGFDTIFSDGTVLEGLTGSITDTGSILAVSFTNGKIYIEGQVFEIEGGTLNVPSTGSHNIGILLQSSIITEEDDFQLRDPIKGGAEYGLPGASRLVWSYQWALNNSKAYNFAKVVEGNLTQTSRKPFDKAELLISQYIKDKNGNFCVKGLEVTGRLINNQGLNQEVKGYNQLSSSVATLAEEVQTAYATTTEALNLVNAIQAELAQANLIALQTPTSENLALVSQLSTSLADAQTTYDQASRNLSTKQASYFKENTNLDSALNLTSDKVELVTNPGVAYLNGNRVEVGFPYKLTFPKDLSAEKVESVVFTYYGSTAKTSRRLSLSSGSTLDQVKEVLGYIELVFSGLLYNESKYTITCKLALKDLTQTTITDILILLVNELNSTSDLNPAIDFTSSLSLSKTSLRRVIKDNLSVSLSGTSSLKFESTTINPEANQLGLVSLVKQAGEVESALLSFNLTSSEFSGAGQSNEFNLGFRPVKDVTSLIATMQELSRPIIRGAIPGTSDTLGDDSSIKIFKVVQGTTTYINGVDFTLTNQSKIDWSLGGLEPDVGTTYYASYSYTKPLVQDKDYSLDRNTDSIKFIGQTPAVDEDFYVDYSYYLIKAGVVFLNETGEVQYKLSESSSNPSYPSIPNQSLPLAKFLLSADKVSVSLEKCKAFTVEELYNLSEQVRTNINNLNAIKLDNLAYKQVVSEINQNPVGIFTNNIQDLSKLNVEDINYTAAISPNTLGLTVPSLRKDVPLIRVSGGSIYRNELDLEDSVSLSYSTIEYSQQPRKTKATKITPTSTSRGKLLVSPKQVFQCKGKVQYNPCDPLSKLTSLVTRTSTNKPAWLDKITSNTKLNYAANGEALAKGLVEGRVAYPNTEDYFIKDIADNYQEVESKVIYLKAENLLPNSDGYKLYFAGSQVLNFSFLNGTPSSTTEGVNGCKAKADGTVEVSFSLPSTTFPGSHLVELKGPNGYCKATVSVYNTLLNHTVFSALYNWNETIPLMSAKTLLPLEKEECQVKALTLNNVQIANSAIPILLSYKVTEAEKFPILYESVSQTFEVATDTFLSEIWLKFKTVETGNLSKIKVYLKKANLDGPSKELLGIAEPILINADLSGDLWSKFKFKFPVILTPNETYCFSIYTDSKNYEVYSSVLGQLDESLNSIVGDQIYLKGDLYNSPDGKVLNKQGLEDLTYTLVRAKFPVGSVVVDLGSYGTANSFPNITHFVLNTRSVIPANTSIKYEYKGQNQVWYEFNPNVVTCLDSQTSGLNLRATLSSESDLVSPVINIRDCSVSLYSNEFTGVTISEKVTYEDFYKTVSVLFKTINSDKNSYTVYFKEANTWIRMVKDSKYKRVIDAGIGLEEVRYNYTSTTNRGPNFTYKVESQTSNKTIPPFVTDIITFVY